MEQAETPKVETPPVLAASTEIRQILNRICISGFTCRLCQGQMHAPDCEFVRALATLDRLETVVLDLDRMAKQQSDLVSSEVLRRILASRADNIAILERRNTDDQRADFFRFFKGDRLAVIGLLDDGIHHLHRLGERSIEPPRTG